jgi:uncharacterized membrane protein
MQVADEGRHLLRAFQIATGGILSQIDPETHQAGGILPLAVFEFVHDKMQIATLQKEDRLATIRARLDLLDRSSRNQVPLREKRFAAFPNATIYPPVLYLPQAAAIWIARQFTDKVYVWFYSARVLNGLVAILLIFSALRIATTHQLLLLIPAVLPTSLYQQSSVSSDASIIGLSIFFVALCIRFIGTDNLAIRTGLVISLCLLTLGRPVHLVAGLLLVGAYRRLGWQRAIAFCAGAISLAGAAYACWSFIVRPFFALAAPESPDRNPHAQILFVTAHPISTAMMVLRTLWLGRTPFGSGIAGNSRMGPFSLIGRFGWGDLPLPSWFYWATIGIALAILACVLANLNINDFVCLAIACLAAGGLVVAIVLASFVLWMPPGSRDALVFGRYALPALAILVFGSPPLNKFSDFSRSILTILIIFLAFLSCFWTVRIVKHYYFSSSTTRGRNVQELYYELPAQSCPASLQTDLRTWFSVVVSGVTTVPNRDYRVVLSDDHGMILGESDPVLIGGDGSRWRLHSWNINRTELGHLWFAVGKSACHFAEIQFSSYVIPPV